MMPSPHIAAWWEQARYECQRDELELRMARRKANPPPRTVAARKGWVTRRARNVRG